MKRGLYTFGIVAALALTVTALTAITAPARADGFGRYIMPGAGVASLGDPTLDNLVYSLEAGVTNGTFAFGVEALAHNHAPGVAAKNETIMGQVKARLFLGDRVVRPAVEAGIGATLEGDPVTSLGAGLLWVANDAGAAGSFNIYAGYTQLFYHADMQHIARPGDWSDSTDGYATIRLMLTF